MRNAWMLLVLLSFPAPGKGSELLPATLREAMAGGDCARAWAAAREIREAGFYGGDPTVLFRAEGALAGERGCGVWPWVELAVGFDLVARREHGVALLDSLARAAEDPLPFRRALALFRLDPEVRLPAAALPSYPDSAGDPRWSVPEARLLDRPDQCLAGGDAWTGPDDASAEIRAGQIGGNLYLRIRVRDDDVRPGEDGVRVLLARVGGGNLASRDPGRLSWVLAVPAGEAPRPGAVDRVPKAWRTVNLTPEGYDVVICVPAGTLDLEFNVGSRRAFDLVLEDRDADGVSLHRWCGRSDDPDDMRLAGILESP